MDTSRLPENRLPKQKLKIPVKEIETNLKTNITMMQIPNLNKK